MIIDNKNLSVNSRTEIKSGDLIKIKGTDNYCFAVSNTLDGEVSGIVSIAGSNNSFLINSNLDTSSLHLFEIVIPFENLVVSSNENSIDYTSGKSKLYEFLDSFDKSGINKSSLSSVYFLVTYDGQTEPIYFHKFEDTYFECPCLLTKTEFQKVNLVKYVSERYEEDAYVEALIHELEMYKDGYLYEIDCPQCLPFLGKIDNIKAISELECLEWLLAHQQI